MFGFLDGMLRAEEMRSKLYALEQAHPTAAMQGKTECCRSGSLDGNDVSAISLRLGLTRQKFFTVGVKQEEWTEAALKQLGWDGWTDDGG